MRYGRINTGGGKREEMYGATIAIMFTGESELAVGAKCVLYLDGDVVGASVVSSNYIATFSDVQTAGVYEIKATVDSEEFKTEVEVTYDDIIQKNTVVSEISIGTQLVNYTMLYDAGDECEDITGGWIGGEYITGYGVTVGTYTKKATSLYCIAPNDVNGYTYTSSGFFTNNKIDTTGTSKIICRVVAIANKYACSICANSDGRQNNSNKLDTKLETNGFGTLDSTKYSGDTYIGFGCWGYSSMIEVDEIFMVKEDNWQEWISKAGLSTDTYTTLDAVIADSTALTTLMNNEAAVKYMLLNCTGTVMASVIQSDTALDILADSAYSTKIYANEHWAKFLAMVA